MAVQIQIRRDTADNWTENDPILAQGEFGYEIDTDKIKIGDGVVTWNNLPYHVGDVKSVSGKIGHVTLNKQDVGLGNVDNTSDSAKPISTATQTALNTKVDKVAGKGLSTEDYTTAEKTKLSGIATGATANSSDATLLARANHTGTQSADTITDGTTNKAFTATERSKLAGIATGAEVNVQSDWTQATNTADSYIKNKPTLGTAAAKNIPATGNASVTEVVYGTDTRLTNARTPVAHTHTAANVTDFDTEVSNNTDVAANTSARHTHSNKSTLDNITAAYTTTEASKLSGIATGATANDTDANLKNRANHTGTQTASTISDFNTAADARVSSGISTHVAASDPHAQYQKESEKGSANGYAELDATGKVPSGRLPSFVDDVIEVANYAALPATGETGKIYVVLDNNITYRWSGSAYVEISSSLALGETSTTAYRGDRGKTAYDHTLNTNNPHGVTKAQVGLSNVDNTSDASKPVSTAQQAAINAATFINPYSVPFRNDGAAGPANNFISVAQTSAANDSIARRTSAGAIFVTTATDNNHAVNKSQMDTADALKVAKAGDTMTGNLNILKDSPFASMVNNATYDGAGGALRVYHNNSMFGNNGGVQFGVSVQDGGAVTQVSFDKISYTGGWQSSLFGFVLQSNFGYFSVPMRTGGNLYPNVNNTIDLGMPSLYYRNFYAKRYYLNSTAYIDGATEGMNKFTGGIVPEPGSGILSNSTSSFMRISGGTADDGGVIVLFGSTHATKPNRGEFRIGSTPSLLWESAGVSLGSVAPTHSLTLPSTATGIALYNTSDQTTNYERIVAKWDTNVWQLFSGANGTGTARKMQIGDVGGYLDFDGAAASGAPKFSYLRVSNTSGSLFRVSTSGAALTGGAGITQYGLKIDPTINQSSTAAYTMLWINPTETATGSGAKLLIDAQVGGVSKFKVDNAGQVTAPKLFLNSTATLDGSTAGQIRAVGDFYISSNGQARLFSTYTGANSNGANIFIGGGGQNSIGAVGQGWLGSSNVSLGVNALNALTTGDNNVALGTYALQANTTGVSNTAVGTNALLANTSGGGNMAVGLAALQANTTGVNNLAIGVRALTTNTTGYGNIALGEDAGRWLSDGSTTNQTAGYGIYIGSGSKASTAGRVNETVIGYSAIGNGSNTVTIGNSSVTGNFFSGNIESTTVSGGVILKSPDGTRYKLTIANGGTVTVSAA